MSKEEGICFSRLTREEIEEVVNEEKQVFKGETLGEDFYLQELELNPWAYYFVLRNSGDFIGFLGVWIRDRSEIINLFVKKTEQNKGYGTFIMDFLEDLLLTAKTKEVSLEVRVSNIKAQRLYLKYGYSKRVIRRRYYSDGEDAYLMVKKYEE